MKLNRENKHMVDILFVLALFLVFAFSSLMLVMVGANVYRKIVEDGSSNFSTQTAYSYITEKIRQQDTELADGSPAVSIEAFGEGDALVLSMQPDEAENAADAPVYKTYIYLYEGSLRELFTRAEMQLGPEAGKEIFPATAFTVEQAGEHLYRFTLQDDASVGSITFQVSTRSGAE